MSSSVSTTTNGVVVITHVHPAGNMEGVGAPTPPHCWGRVGPVVSSVMEKFRGGHPKALGAVQIMFGSMALLIGTVMALDTNSLGVFSGIFVWGAIIYIIAGSLTIAAEKSLNKCLVKGSLGMNVVAAVTAFAGIVIHTLDAAGVFYYCDVYPYDPYRLYYCNLYWSRSQGISGVMAVFSLLEFTVTISVSAFACKAVCHLTPQVFIIGNNPPHSGTMAPPTLNSPPDTYQASRISGGPDTPAFNNTVPPQYSPTVSP